jgi:AcrR family transcriptional regulator
MAGADGYHHGDLKAELVRLGLEALEAGGAEALSLRAIAEKAGVSKAAPYRHFPDRDYFLGVLADEGFRLLCEALEKPAAMGAAHGTARGAARGATLAAMGRAFMAFAVAHPELYRLMNSPLATRLPEELYGNARRSMEILGSGLSGGEPGALPRDSAGRRKVANAAAAAWAYIHGLVMLRIDGLFPAWLPEPDWDRLAGRLPLEVADALTGAAKTCRPTSG